MLQATHLRKTFTSLVAVDDVSLTARSGRILGLLGPNGAGKTTTIRMILNILSPDSGHVSYEGKPFSKEVVSTIGYVPEERGLYRKSRLLDSIVYFAELKGMTRTAARDEAGRWLRRFMLDGQEGRRLEELSKGNQQKVQFILAVVHDPRLLVLDEPFSGLDPVNQEMMKGVLLDLRDQGKALILSTHQMEQAEEMSDDLTLIDHGTVVLSGSIGDVKKRYGKNSVRVEFAGDESLIRTIDGVARIALSPNVAELELLSGEDPQRVLKQLVELVEIRSFEVVEPSLRSIFMRVVGTPA